MPHIKPVAASGETTISDECDFLDQAAPSNCAGRREHFAHAWATDRTLVTDDNDITSDDIAAENADECVFLAFIDFGSAFKVETFFASDLANSTFRGEIAAQDTKVSGLFNRLIERANDILLVRKTCVRLYILQRLGNGFAGDGEAIAMQHAAVE